MKIAVIGSGGLLGNALTRFFAEAGDEVVALDLPDFDVTSRLIVLDTLSEVRPEVVLNAAALTDIDWLERHPNTARNVHLHGTRLLCEGADRIGAFFVQISCMECVAGESVFAATRRESERIALEASRSLIVRTSTLFGPPGSRSGVNLVDTVLKAVRRIRRFQAIDDVVSSPTYTLHFAERLRPLILDHLSKPSGFPGPIHALSASGRASAADVIRQLAVLTGLALHVEPISLRDYGCLAHRSPDTSVEQGEIPAWEEGLRAYLEHRAAR